MKQNLADILLVEDNPSDAMLTTMAFKEAKLANTVVHVKDGQEALDYIYCTGIYASRNFENMPCLILLDLKMPKVNGIEVLKIIKADERTKMIPVAVFTSSKEDPDVEECYRLEANSYIIKPLDFDAFVKVVKEVELYWLLINYRK